MNNDLTIDTLTFALQYSDKSDGSVRREVSRGVNLPTELKIAHSTYVDSATKLPGKRGVARFDRYIELSTGNVAPVSAYIVVTHPNDADVTSTDILAVINHLVCLLQEDDTGLDLMDEIFVNKLQ
jgi:hypothetical protein